MADLVIFYHKPWLILLVLLERCRRVDLRNVGKNGTYDNALATLRATLAGFFVERDWSFVGLVGFLHDEDEVLLRTIGWRGGGAGAGAGPGGRGGGEPPMAGVAVLCMLMGRPSERQVVRPVVPGKKRRVPLDSNSIQQGGASGR